MGESQQLSIYHQAKAEALRVFWEPQGSGMTYHDAVEAGIGRIVTTEESARALLLEILETRPCPESFFRSAPRSATWTEFIRYLGAEVLREEVGDNARELTAESDRRIEAGEAPAARRPEPWWSTT
jgi:hypothetical protein